MDTAAFNMTGQNANLKSKPKILKIKEQNPRSSQMVEAITMV
jgi:hypothetical protein